MNKNQHNLTLLKIIAEQDSAKIISKYNKNYKFEESTKVKFQCKCGNLGEKTLRRCNTGGMFCRKCIYARSSAKHKKTCLEKYGVDHPMKAEKIVEKSKKTCLEKYGVEYSFQSETVKDKIKETNIERYGVEYVVSSKEIQDKIKTTFIEKYGTTVPMRNEEVKDKVRKTCLEKYGVDNAFKAESVKDKIKDILLEKYGVEHALQSKEIYEKFKNTLYENYGVENPSHSEELRERSKKACLEKYGVEYVMQSEEIKQKAKKTMLERYGVEHTMHLPEFVEKSFQNSFSQKEFVMPSGDIRLVQGYEPKALKKLISMYEEDDIVTDIKLVPVIDYIYQEKNCKYFPDIYIKSENKIIEVKSTFTFYKELDKNNHKGEACTSNGYLFEFWIYSSNNCEGEIIEY